jgi:hypothetical protein
VLLQQGKDYSWKDLSGLHTTGKALCTKWLAASAMMSNKGWKGLRKQTAIEEAERLVEVEVEQQH